MNGLSAQFRDAMRRVAATVCVITVDDHGTPMGMTATAMSSLSADPPSLLVCVNQSASMHNALADAARFCVNVLHRDQAGIADRFAKVRPSDACFETDGWKLENGGPPILPDAQASLMCERQQLIAFATHTICIGTVTRIVMREAVDPLLYLNGAYGAAMI